MHSIRSLDRCKSEPTWNGTRRTSRTSEARGYTPSVTRTQSSSGFRAALEEGSPDVIISDYAIPGYGGLTALADLKASGKDVPFILVSGTVWENIAVEAMRAGAHDYVLKGDLTRLPVAVEREVLDCQVRAEQARMMSSLLHRMWPHRSVPRLPSGADDSARHGLFKCSVSPAPL